MKLKKLLKCISGFEDFQLCDCRAAKALTPVVYQEDSGVFEAIKPYLDCKVKRIGSGTVTDGTGTYIGIGLDLDGGTKPDQKNTVVEFCSNFENEIEVCWDVKQDGFKAFCPVCGERLMLCSECREHGNISDYDSETDSCKFHPNRMDIPEIIAGLEELSSDRTDFWESTKDDIFLHDMEVLSAAVERLREMEGGTDE